MKAMVRSLCVLLAVGTVSALRAPLPPRSLSEGCAAVPPRRTVPRLCAVQLSETDAQPPATLESSVSWMPLGWLWRVPLKWRVLGLLVIQNAATTLVVGATRRPRPEGSVLYLGGAAVLVSEVLKLLICLAKIAHDEGGAGGMVREVRYTLSRVSDTARMGVPALSYGAQNILYYTALSHLSATSYQLWSQTKILFTALFFVQILGQMLLPRQWLALGLLTLGVGLVQLADAAGTTAAVAASGSMGVASIGIAAVLASSALSGFANVYFEKVLKQAECEFNDECELEGARREPVTLWLRNVQLGVFAIPQVGAVAACGGLVGAVAACGGLVVAVVACGGLWWLVVACGGLWAPVEGCGGLWWPSAASSDGFWRKLMAPAAL